MKWNRTSEGWSQDVEPHRGDKKELKSLVIHCAW